MLCAESLTILPIGCIIGQKNLLQKYSPVQEFNQAPFVLRSCVQPAAYLCSTAAHGSWTQKKCTAIFTTILPQFTAVLSQFFQALGDCNPPPPTRVEPVCRKCRPCLENGCATCAVNSLVLRSGHGCIGIRIWRVCKAHRGQKRGRPAPYRASDFYCGDHPKSSFASCVGGRTSRLGAA